MAEEAYRMSDFLDEDDFFDGFQLDHHFICGDMTVHPDRKDGAGVVFGRDFWVGELQVDQADFLFTEVGEDGIEGLPALVFDVEVYFR